MTVWAVVVHYGDAATTSSCLDALRVGTVVPDRTVVVDNQGDFDDTGVIIDRPDRNVGFAAAAAWGVEAAAEGGATYVWILNNDAVAAPDCLGELVDAAEALPRAGLLSPVIAYPQGAGLWYAGGRVEVPSFRVAHETVVRERAAPYETGYITGCAPLVRCDALRECGPPDDTLFMYFEDVEWSLRMARHGWRTVVVPTAVVEHAVPRRGRRREYSPDAVYYMTRNRLALARRYGSCAAGLAPALGWAARQMLKALRWGGSRAVAAAVAQGLRDGCRGVGGPRATSRRARSAAP